MTTITSQSEAHMAAVRAGFEAFARGDLAAFAEGYAPDATWNHRNPDRLGGVHRGIDEILEFLKESGRSTTGTLRAVPTAMMADGEGHVCVLTRVSASRPDGRTFDDTQVLVFHIDGQLVRSVDQYIGDPPTVTAFWA